MAVKGYETEKGVNNVEPLIVGRINDTDWMQLLRIGFVCRFSNERLSAVQEGHLVRSY
jgi:hypothetical protein